MIENLTERIKESLNMSFQKFAGWKQDNFTKQDKLNVVVSFLAMLELVKQGVLAVKQTCHFGDIEMENQEVGIPNYK
jgi:chromatin segregation and condensation protein Rec8/ScpA/Scc1 (kleisin family)